MITRRPFPCLASLVAVGVVACGPPADPKAPGSEPATSAPAHSSAPPESAQPAPSAEPRPSAALPLWMVGHWVRGDDAGSETWVAAGPTLVGVGFAATSAGTTWFEALSITERDGVLTYTAVPGGQQAVDFALAERGPGSIAFVNPAHDHPQRISYRRQGDTLTASIESEHGGRQEWTWRRAEPEPARGLESAEIRFAAGVADRGVEGWSSIFEDSGVMWTAGRQLLRGRDEIDAHMRRAPSPSGAPVTWEPTASLSSPAGDLGVTIGRYGHPPETSASPAVDDQDAGSYLTVWRRQTGGAWRITFHARVRDGRPDRP